MAFHVSWHLKFRGTTRGISRTQISWYYTWRSPSRNPVACKSMVTRQISKSHTLTFACDTRKLTRVCEVIVELYRRSQEWMHESESDHAGNAFLIFSCQVIMKQQKMCHVQHTSMTLPLCN